jgi:ADP-ribose pyrophosphatase
VSAPGNDETFWRLVLEHPGAVVILAVDAEDRALVLRQYRHAAELRFVELPAGLLDQPGEDPLQTAQRELLEEGGVEAGEWVHLNHLHNSPGFSSERIDIYLARDLRPADRGDFEPAHEEADMSVHWVPVDDLVRAVLDKRLTDGPLTTAVLTYALTRARDGREGRV